MDFEKIEIRISGCDYNMAAWHYEKSLSIVKNIAQIAAQLKKESEPNETLTTNIYSALHNATKILSFSCGAHWEMTDPKLILNKGSEGLEELLVNYGVINETTTQKSNRVHQKATLNILELLENNKASEARTLIHEILYKVHSNDEQWEKIKSLTESLTMNEIKWDTYKAEVKSILISMAKQI